MAVSSSSSTSIQKSFKYDVFLSFRGADSRTNLIGHLYPGLKEATDLAANGSKAGFIKKIIQDISLKLYTISFSFDKNLVGLETRVNDIVSSLRIGIDDVRMIGIKGMGGVGKTTLARAIFDKISIRFEGKSFVENVREVTSTSSSGLKSLQQQILSDVLND